MIRGALGCSFALSAVVFILAFAIITVASGFDFLSALGIASMITGMLFVAAFGLAMRDSMTQFQTRRLVRQFLLAGGDASDEEFAERYPNIEPVLMHEIRDALALCFNVPKSKIRASHSLERDLRLSVFGPGVGFYAIGRALESRGLQPNSVVGFSDNVKDFNDFAKQIEIAIKEAKQASPESKPGDEGGS